MRIAIPTIEGRVFPDCGHNGQFTMVDLERSTKTVRHSITLATPPFRAGELAEWLGEQKVELVITRGLRRQDLALLAQRGIQVVVGAPSYRVEAIVARFLAGTLEPGPNVCADEAIAFPFPAFNNPTERKRL
jgi:predicted Fe-Mo cluster-binding NifX family protein